MEKSEIIPLLDNLHPTGIDSLIDTSAIGDQV